MNSETLAINKIAEFVDCSDRKLSRSSISHVISYVIPW